MPLLKLGSNTTIPKSFIENDELGTGIVFTSPITLYTMETRGNIGKITFVKHSNDIFDNINGIEVIDDDNLSTSIIKCKSARSEYRDSDFKFILSVEANKCKIFVNGRLKIGTGNSSEIRLTCNYISLIEAEAIAKDMRLNVISYIPDPLSMSLMDKMNRIALNYNEAYLFKSSLDESGYGCYLLCSSEKRYFRDIDSNYLIVGDQDRIIDFLRICYYDSNYISQYSREVRNEMMSFIIRQLRM